MRSSGFFKNATAQQPTSVIPEDKSLVYTSPDGHTMLWKTVFDQRLVALKTLQPGVRTDPLYLGRLRREYEIGINLKHPGICETLGWIADCGDGPGIIMEWIEGDTLESLLSSTPSLPYHKIASELCEAVAYLHRKQVIHKDLKPSNILITRRSKNVKIIDFGLSDSDSIITGKEPAGTLDYAAPEVVAGGSADERSDIYSLGVILHRLSTDYFRIAASCCSESPEKRPSSAEAILTAIQKDKGHRRPSWLYIVITALIVGVLVWALIKPGKDEVKELFEEAVQMTLNAGATESSEV